MKRTAALRVTGEICFYYSILTLFPAFQRWCLPMAGFALACLVVGLIAVGLRSMPLRLLLSLLPGVCFLFVPLHWMLVFPCLAWVYFILFLCLGRFDVALYEYRHAVRWMLIISAFVLAGQAVNSTLFNGAVISYASLGFLVAFILLVVVALRGMQMGAPMDARWHAANTLTVAVTLLVSVGVALLLYQLYIHSAPVLSFIFLPLRRFLQWLFGLFRFRALPEVAQSTPPLETQPIIFTKDNFLNTERELFAPDKIETSSFHRLSEQALNLGAFVILAFLLFIVLWLIVKLVRRGREFAEEGVEYEQTEDFTPDRKRRNGRPETVHGPAQSVRKLYREYLDYLKENGLQRSVSDTSAEILAESERISETSAPDEEALRRIYLKARYSAETVTEEDVAAARRSLDAIRSRERS